MKTIQIPDAAPPDRAMAIERALDELTSEYDGGWVTFACQGSDRVVEVAFDDPNFALNIPHAEKGGLLPRLQETGFALPTAWTVTEDKKKGFFASGYLTAEVGKQSKPELAAFIDRFGREFLRWPQGQSLSASFQKF